jgi:hypothetical protein
MERDHLVRDDFPKAHGTEGFDVDSVGAHLAAVAAHVAALEARITALEVERDTLRRQLTEARDHEEGPSGLPDPGPDPLQNLGREAEKSPVDELPADPEPDEDAGAAPGEDEVAARLLASKLAMGGTSRDTIVMQVAAAHEVDNPGALVDDVLAHLA